MRRQNSGLPNRAQVIYCHGGPVGYIQHKTEVRNELASCDTGIVACPMYSLSAEHESHVPPTRSGNEETMALVSNSDYLGHT